MRPSGRIPDYTALHAILASPHRLTCWRGYNSSSMAKEPSISSLAQRLDRVRELRNRPDADLSMRFLKKQFSQQVAQPHKQLSAFAQAWRASLPAALVEQTRLESLSRGVLRVSVTSSAHLFEIDRLLRSGLEQRILGASRGSTVRRIALVVASPSPSEPTSRNP
jgi:hypothetical protein